MDQVSHAWEFLLMLGAGTGLVYILRWYWWRVNAWSEVSAMASALVTSLALRFLFDTSTPKGFALTLIATTAITTIVWLAVTFMTNPEPRETLQAFYARVRPDGKGWRHIALEANIPGETGELARNGVRWILGVVLVYSIMFATGSLLFGDMQRLAVFGLIVLASGLGLIAMMRKAPADGRVAPPGR
jgi:hypothetical protein